MAENINHIELKLATIQENIMNIAANANEQLTNEDFNGTDDAKARNFLENVATIADFDNLTTNSINFTTCDDLNTQIPQMTFKSFKYFQI